LKSSTKMPLIRTGIALGIETFLILDMAVIHQLFRLQGVLFSNYFEYAVLLVSLGFAARSLLARKWSFTSYLIRHGILMGFGGTLFLDVVLVDQVLKLHSVNYPQPVNIGSGMIGLVLVVVGLYGWRVPKQVLS